MTKHRSLILRLIGFSLLIVAIFVANKGINYGILLTALDDVNALHLTLASIVILIVMALSTSRFALINRKFGGNEDWLFLHRVNMLSILYSQIALPLIAQIIGRVAHGSLAQRQNYASMTVIEKSIAFAIMAALGGSASFLLLNKNIIPSGLFSAFILLGGAIAITVLACYLVFLTLPSGAKSSLIWQNTPTRHLAHHWPFTDNPAWYFTCLYNSCASICA